MITEPLKQQFPQKMMKTKYGYVAPVSYTLCVNKDVYIGSVYWKVRVDVPFVAKHD